MGKAPDSGLSPLIRRFVASGVIVQLWARYAIGEVHGPVVFTMIAWGRGAGLAPIAFGCVVDADIGGCGSDVGAVAVEEVTDGVDVGHFK